MYNICEYCYSEHCGAFATGRFCNRSCANGFSSRDKREEINKKVSAKLSIHSHLPKVCRCCNAIFYSRFKKQINCSRACANVAKVGKKTSASTKNKLSLRRIEAIKEGKVNIATKCVYSFNGEDIPCDSKIEYACLDYFEANYDVVYISRCMYTLTYVDMSGQMRRFLPDFTIKSSEKEFIVECKGYIMGNSLNEKWRKYKEVSEIKKKSLEEFAKEKGIESFWFTPLNHLKFYKAL